MIKVLKPVRSYKILREVKILLEMEHPSIIELLDIGFSEKLRLRFFVSFSVLTPFPARSSNSFILKI